MAEAMGKVSERMETSQSASSSMIRAVVVLALMMLIV